MDKSLKFNAEQKKLEQEKISTNSIYVKYQSYAIRSQDNDFSQERGRDPG